MASSSRLPRLQPSSSPDHQPTQLPTPAMPASFSNSLSSMVSTRKRKAVDDDTANQPRKLPAIAEDGAQRPIKPLRQNRTAINTASSKLGLGPPPLTKPRAPAFSGARMTRAVSAPPKSISIVRPVARPPSAAGVRSATGRTNFGPSRPGNGDDKRFLPLQNRMQSIESGRAADSAPLAADMEAERAKVSALETSRLAISKELEDAKNKGRVQHRELMNASDEIEALKKKHAREVTDLEMNVKKQDRKIRELGEELCLARSDLDREREMVGKLKSAVAQQSTAQLTLTTQNQALQAQLNVLQSSFNCSADTVSSLRYESDSARKKIAELEHEAREAEMVRRKLHNMVQELKGNIRVFCRVRPLLPSDIPTGNGRNSPNSMSPGEQERARLEALADIAFPDKRDHKDIVFSSSSENAMGQERKEAWNFGFDRVFEPNSTQDEVFEEISQLAQSCTDGYNVCIFAYGQTGSGKSFTMEGGSTEATAGMIPRAVEQVFRVAEELRSKGWEYTMQGQFLEIYNETINDLLGKGEFDKKKHEIKHDKNGTRVTDVVVQPLHSPMQVRALLALAQSRRSVAATLMNERSSRSHSVFTLHIRGTNRLTGESCEGSLNLVDLAGSERLNASGAGSDRERLRETQSINKSLSALGDVIAALGEKGEKGDKHIPYRNSKLTYLLKNSLSGNSKTLMVLNLSPMAVHLNESLCSLRFATKASHPACQQHDYWYGKKADQELVTPLSNLVVRRLPRSTPSRTRVLPLLRTPFPSSFVIVNY
ncbi:hypothetical protein EW146_g3050 [Bondarzewia mesenterica]|uniref:Kinesin-like protein n=1 Tax=Bondarzewia mesenterica TaxID=1095465 RepID=A0A4S4LZA0_9AGAM|nr:hypothetical protein EW146_g3050 [Bondarzewia mesenterica]